MEHGNLGNSMKRRTQTKTGECCIRLTPITRRMKIPTAPHTLIYNTHA